MCFICHASTAKKNFPEIKTGFEQSLLMNELHDLFFFSSTPQLREFKNCAIKAKSKFIIYQCF